jgi:two-component system nitrogen regulation sensor histidine kinase GlnL
MSSNAFIHRGFAAPRPEVKTKPDASDVLVALQTAILIIDPQGRIADVNAAGEAVLNISATHLVGRELTEILTVPSGFDAATIGPFAAYEVNLSTARGANFRADFLVTPFADWPGWRLVAIHAAASAYRMGHRLERAGGTRSAIGVAAMLAHEIKNPLSGIRGAAQLLESKASEDDSRMTRLIRTEVDRIAGLLDQMEGFTDTRPRTPAPDNIHEIIDHVRQVAQTGFGSALRIVDSYDPSLPPVLVHRDSLVQILLNLLKNAAETASEGETRTVRIKTAYRQGVSLAVESGSRRRSLPIELCVIDDGPGAPPELADDMFDPFVSTKKSGRGLGLAIADKLVRDMGGIIQYAREGDPQMTVFRLLLQRAEREKA